MTIAPPCCASSRRGTAALRPCGGSRILSHHACAGRDRRAGAAGTGPVRGQIRHRHPLLRDGEGGRARLPRLHPAGRSTAGAPGHVRGHGHHAGGHAQRGPRSGGASPTWPPRQLFQPPDRPLDPPVGAFEDPRGCQYRAPRRVAAGACAGGRDEPHRPWRLPHRQSHVPPHPPGGGGGAGLGIVHAGASPGGPRPLRHGLGIAAGGIRRHRRARPRCAGHSRARRFRGGLSGGGDPWRASSPTSTWPSPCFAGR